MALKVLLLLIGIFSLGGIIAGELVGLLDLTSDNQKVVAQPVQTVSPTPSESGSSPAPETPSPVPLEAKTITLLEAWEIAQTAGLSWQPDAVLTQLSSADIGDNPDITSGTDGTRRTWLASFSSSTTIYNSR